MSNDSPIELKFIYKYPWLEGGREIFESNQSTELEDPIDVVKYFKEFFGEFFGKYTDKDKDLKLRINKVFIFALDKREEGIILTEDHFNVVFFYLIKTLLAAFNNRVLDNHVANFLSKIYYQKIKDENDRDLVKFSNYMGLRCFLLTQPKRFDTINGITKFPYWIEFPSYIPTANLLKDNSRALVNQYFEKGRIYLLRDQVIRLLQEKIRMTIIPERIGIMADFLENLKKVDDIAEIITTIENKIELIKIESRKYKKQGGIDFIDDDEKPIYELYPPCIKFILNKALEGNNLTHNERLHVAFFYANTNHSVEETVDVFRTVPDFDEKIARYNVEFSRGIDGKGKKYKVFNCGKLQSLQICKADDKKFGDTICIKGVRKKGEPNFQPIKSPHSYIFWKKVEKNREQRQFNKKNSEK
ncbi:MAG: hypothetical protein GY870_01255 [archaeon]|nr:hypothetical protein [archaeon]